eukprot:SAG31_NODE_19896_length_589_cov_0.710204_1_plen_132_part_00
MSRILSVNGVAVRNKAEILAELKKLKAAGASEVSFGFQLPSGTQGGGKPMPSKALPVRQKSKPLTDALGKPLKPGGDAQRGGLSDEFAEEADEHFVFTVGTTLRGGQYAQPAPLGSGVFARVVQAVDTATR